MIVAFSISPVGGEESGGVGDAVADAVRVVRESGLPNDTDAMFAVLPRRWVVERTLSWISRCRRLDHDYERLPEHSEAMIKWAMIGLMARRLEPAPGRRAWQPTAAA